MADLKQRIQRIKHFFLEMQVVPDEGTSVIYVAVKFPNRWLIADDIEKKFNVNVIREETEPNKYYFCSDIEVGFEAVFDAIDYNINKMKTAQERAQLLQQKVLELRELFENEDIPLDTLRTIDFSQYSLMVNSNETVPVLAQTKTNCAISEKSIDSEQTDNEEGGILTKITSSRKKKTKDNTETK